MLKFYFEPRCFLFNEIWWICLTHSDIVTPYFGWHKSVTTLAQVMVCHLFSTKPLFELMLTYSQLNPQKQIQGDFNKKKDIFSHENAFGKVICKVAAILFWAHWIESTWIIFKKALCIFKMNKKWVMKAWTMLHSNGLVQEICNSLVSSLEFCLSCTKPSM